MGRESGGRRWRAERSRPGFCGRQVHGQVQTERERPEHMEKQLPPDAHTAQWLEHGRESGAQGPALCQRTVPCLGLFLPTRKIFKDISGFHLLTCGDSGPPKGPSENSLLRRFRVVGMAGSFQSSFCSLLGFQMGPWKGVGERKGRGEKV